MTKGKSTFEVGEKVMAKWPGSTKFYEATVTSLADAKSKYLCTVTFLSSDEMSAEMKQGEVYKPAFFSRVSRGRSASPSRNRSQSPSRRRSRTRSPARDRRRSRSPARKSPARKSTSKMEPKTKEESPTNTTRSSPRKRTKMAAEPKPAKVEAVKADTPSRVTRSVTRKLVVEEKEALLSTEKEQNKTKSQKEYEFGGPVGATVMIFGLPILVLAFYIYCNRSNLQCSLASLKTKPPIPPLNQFFDLSCFMIYGAYLLFLATLYVLPIGKVVQGQPLSDGSQLKYRVNAFMSLVLSLAGFSALVYFKYPVTVLYDKFLAFITTTLVFSAFFSVALYIKARRAVAGHASNTGCFPYDFFMGHELNPRIGNFDFKFFCELRPSLIGWVLVNLCMAVKEYENRGQVSPAMILVCTFQLLYVADALWFEASILSTMDIVSEGFGYMLVLGDLAFVPFMYSLQARFLVDHEVNLSWLHVSAFVMLFVVGYVIFRGSNAQKDKFRNNPYDIVFKDKETVLTASGRKLLASGWWGLVRHPNYLGDIIMAIAWTLPCGLTHLIPWFYPVYLTILLVHREFRDEAHCRRKYGKSWDEYCRRVPYRIFPKVF